MSKFTPISQEQMEKLLQVGDDGKPTGDLKFYRLTIPGTYELVYGKLVRKDLTLRVYSTIVNGVSREKGDDAIRVVLFWKETPESEPRIVGVEKKVLRVEGWRKNLLTRINGWSDMLGPECDACGSPTARRKGRRGYFYGCAKYPQCRGYGKKEK